MRILGFTMIIPIGLARVLPVVPIAMHPPSRLLSTLVVTMVLSGLRAIIGILIPAPLIVLVVVTIVALIGPPVILPLRISH